MRGSSPRMTRGYADDSVIARSPTPRGGCKGKSMEVNGIAHVFLTASNFERSREFYRKLLPFLGLKPMIDSDQVYYCARERADIDELHDFLCSIGTTIIRAPREDGWAPGYYSLLFEDPDGIRLELNHVPGKGVLA
jgi:catechol 2,3-dioxygenase-like lactoylglutathione lyase family enzyme